MGNKNIIALYLGAIVLANLLAATFGPQITILNAFLFIGLDLSSRDKLHEAWHGKGLVWKMGLLILVGSVVSYLFNKNAGQIAVASFVAFGAAAIVDTLVYQVLYRFPRFTKMNGSNIASAAVDSLVFPTLAFGGFLPLITLGQFLAKVLGGAVWAWILTRNDLKGLR
jgi:uncharacterized PurR-regulated membrane protein YhhQ (DUF165 family)